MITIAYITARLDPRLDLFFDSITDQKKERELYQKTATFRSVENDTYIDYDGQPIEDL